LLTTTSPWNEEGVRSCAMAIQPFRSEKAAAPKGSSDGFPVSQMPTPARGSGAASPDGAIAAAITTTPAAHPQLFMVMPSSAYPGPGKRRAPGPLHFGVRGRVNPEK